MRIGTSICFRISLILGILYAAATPTFASLMTTAQVVGGPGCLNNGTATADCSQQYTFGDASAGGYANGGADARAFYGILGASSNMNTGGYATNGTDGISAYSTANANFGDIITVITPGQQSGYLQFSFALTGGTTSAIYKGDPADNTHGSSYAQVDVNGNYYASVTGSGTVTYTWDSNFSTTYDPSTHQYDATLPIFVALYVESSCSAYASYTSTPDTCETSAGFYDTLQVTGIEVFDSNGNAISGAALTSQSGTDYNNLASDNPVPEPSTISLVGLGCCLLGLAKQMRRQRTAS